MRWIYFLFILCASSTSESTINNESKVESNHPYASYFYKYDTTAVIYRYRDVTHGLAEQFHRVYGVEDSRGKHIVVERYAAEGRLTEALNFNLNALNVIDHMVVNGLGENEKATLYKDALLPNKTGEKVSFASKFSGFIDSTVLLMEKDRVLEETLSLEVLSKQTESILIKEEASYTLINPYTEQEQLQQLTMYYAFAKDVGLCEWYDKTKRSHFKLEEILSQDKWIKMLTR